MKHLLVSTLVLALAAAGCSAAEPDEPIVPDAIETSPPATTVGAVQSARPAVTAAPAEVIVLEEGEQRFEGIYGAAPSNDGGHRFQGTFVDTDDGKHIVLSYSPAPEREGLVGKRVVVVGRTYVNEGRSIAGIHLNARIVQPATPR